MSSWNIGLDDVSEEIQAFKDKISSKDGEIAAQQSKLMKQAEELEEIRSTLNDTLHKLSHETDRAIHLEGSLARCSDDLRNEKVNSQNNGAVHAAAQERMKAQDLEIRNLQAIIDTLSHRSDEADARSARLEREKCSMESRVRELEVNMREIDTPKPNHVRHPPARPRSSSLSNFRSTKLEKDLTDARLALSNKEYDLTQVYNKLASIQNELVRVGNEKMAIEKRLKAQLDDLQASLDDKEEEIEFLRGQQGDRSHEEQLLKRVDEDEAKILALEMLLRDAQDSHLTKKMEQRLQAEVQKVALGEARHIELVREKEEALDELECARGRIQALAALIQNKESCIEILQANERDLTNKLALLTSANEAVLPGWTLLEAPDDHAGPPLDAQVLSDEGTINHIERLLAAIERLRGERDNLRRDLQFLETESSFTVKALESRIAELSMVGDQPGVIKSLKEEVQGKELQIRHLSLTSIASLITVDHLQSQADVVMDRFLDVSGVLEPMQSRLEETEKSLESALARSAEVDLKLQISVQYLKDAACQREELQSRVSQLESTDAERVAELERMKALQVETQDRLQQTQARLEEITQLLEDTESDRDSLKLQLTNLSAEFHSAQQDLAEAENRYSSLQFHQLSTMSSNEATRALREQLEELEMRVMRRTEQIGIHQHDIKRLETNLRLQEERVGEMTAELEMVAAQKEAMVEDCADAREARDEAILREEALEVQVEALEGRVEEREKEIATLVGVVMETVSRARKVMTASAQAAARKEEGARRAEAKLQKDLQDLSVLQGSTALLLEEKMSSLETLKDTSMNNIRQMAVTIAITQVDRMKNVISLQTEGEAKRILQEEVYKLRTQLNTSLADVAGLQERLDTLVTAASQSEVLLKNRTADYEAKIYDLQLAVTEIEEKSRETNDALERSVTGLGERLEEAERLLANNDLQSALDQVNDRHVEELSDLHKQLAESASALEEARNSFATAEATNRDALMDSDQAKQELQNDLAATSSRLLEVERVKSELMQKYAEHEREVGRLQESLDAAISSLEVVQRDRNDLKTLHKQANDDLQRTRDDYETRLAQSTEESLLVRQRLEMQLSGVNAKNAELEAQFKDQAQKFQAREHSLQDEIRHLTRAQDSHIAEINSAAERHKLAEIDREQLDRELTTTRRDLEQTRLMLDSLEGEKNSLQVEMSNLEAEIQRSLSISRYLEGQAKDNERMIVSLKEALETTRVDLARSEKSGQAAIVNISLQSAQHEREMSALRRDLLALQTKPDHSNLVANLEERNNEMEELLRSKCAEIEENDDRVLEILKEKKKLATKVESLTRKVQTLQSKLATLKALTPPPASEPANVILASDSTSTHIPPVPPMPVRQRSTTMVSTPVSTQTPLAPLTRTLPVRVASGPSSLPRPKTPERRVVPPPVFKARTPDKRIEPMSDPPSSSVGKKRRTPDDFEDCESIPPQCFTVNGLPDSRGDNSSPRVRRVLHGIQSGFTPVRHTTRPTLPIPSPKRTVNGAAGLSPFIADVTNSPRVMSQGPSHTKTSKRSWLGKIRGVSTQPAARAVSFRPVFDRPTDLS